MQPSRFPVLIAILVDISIVFSVSSRSFGSAHRDMAALFVHWFLAGFIFSYPLGYAYIAGLNAARDPENRLTLLSPWTHFKRDFRKVVARYDWLLVAYLILFMLQTILSPRTNPSGLAAIMILQAFFVQNALALWLAPRFYRAKTFVTVLNVSHLLFIISQTACYVRYPNTSLFVALIIPIAMLSFAFVVFVIRYFVKTAWFRLDREPSAG